MQGDFVDLLSFFLIMISFPTDFKTSFLSKIAEISLTTDVYVLPFPELCPLSDVQSKKGFVIRHSQ